jgi:cytochrome c-type biogenesis protein CcmH
LALLLCVLLLLAGSPDEVQAQGDSLSPRFAPVTAADSAIERMTTILASELRCPVCQGNSIQDSPSELALQMRDVIRDQLRAGKTPDEVRGYFVDKYGEWILLAPKAEGLNLLVYLIPLVAVLAGGLIVWRTVRRWTSPADRTLPDA